jgi:hypothetical protein
MNKVKKAELKAKYDKQKTKTKYKKKNWCTRWSKQSFLESRRLNPKKHALKLDGTKRLTKIHTCDSNCYPLKD